MKPFSANTQLTSTLQQARALVNAEGGEILVLNQAAPPLVSTIGSPLLPSRDTRPNHSSIQDTIIGWLDQRKDILTVFGPERNPRLIPPADLPARTALVALPLQGESKPVGYLALWRSGRPFEPDEIALLRAFVDKSRALVEAARAYSQIERALSRRTEELTLLVDAGAAFSSARDLDGLLPLLAEKMARSAETTFCRIALIDEEGRCLTPRAFFALHDIGPDPAAGLKFAVEELPRHRHAIANCEPLFLSDEQPGPLLEPEHSLLFGLGARSILLVPLVAKDRVFGLAIMGEVRRRERSAIFPDKVDLCVAMARQAALAIGNILSVVREEELVRIKSELISMISHELRTPLASISASTQLLARADLESDARNSTTELLNRQCNRLMRLADQVLDASRLEKGRIELVPEPLALAPLIEQTIGTFRSLHPDHPFVVQDPPKSVFALGDPISIGIVLENLIRNAISYSPENTPITITVEENDDHVVVAVRDEGIGIPANQLDCVFQQFHRVRLASKESGFGLGLYISKMLVEAQGGRIWAESELGKGSCFRFTLRRLDDKDPDY